VLKPIDRGRRDGPLYPGSPKTLGDFIAPKHLLRRIDANFDFAALVAFLDVHYAAWIGRPAVHPEVLIRALVLGSIYDISSERQLCERIAENLAWRWFCFLTLDDAVFDHSTLTVFRERLGPEGFQGLLTRLNAELARLELLSPRTYVDSSLVAADVRTADLPSTDLSPEEFARRATETAGVYTIAEKVPADLEEAQPARLDFKRYQDPTGRLPLSSVDPDARWRRHTRSGPATLGYKETIIVDKSGFVLARQVSPANTTDPDEAIPLLDGLPIQPKSLCGDAGYRAVRFRLALHRRGITPYIPLACSQEITGTEQLAERGFTFHGDHVVCREGKVLAWAGYADDEGGLQFVARQADCRVCPVRASCLAPKETRKHVRVSRYAYTFRRAARINATARYQREIRRRKTTAEGVFAHFDRLAWDRAHFRGRDKVDCQGSIAAFAHNVLKALTKRRFWGREAQAHMETLRSPYPSSSTLPPLHFSRPPIPSLVFGRQAASRFSTGRLKWLWH
jgi:transposase